MARKYDVSRRAEQASRTRETILETAFRLHGMGITDYETLAAEANVSLATVRKHFPNKEVLYEGCTAWGLHRAAFPDFAAIGAETAAPQRVLLALSQMHAFYESLMGQLWAMYHELNGSAVMRNQMAELNALRSKVVSLALEPWNVPAEARGFTEGVFSFLSYYALRTEGGLPPDQVSARLGHALLCTLEALSLPDAKEAANS